MLAAGCAGVLRLTVAGVSCTLTISSCLAATAFSMPGNAAAILRNNACRPSHISSQASKNGYGTAAKQGQHHGHVFITRMSQMPIYRHKRTDVLNWQHGQCCACKAARHSCPPAVPVGANSHPASAILCVNVVAADPSCCGCSGPIKLNYAHELTLMLKPALALVSMKLTDSSRALASPSSSDTCLHTQHHAIKLAQPCAVWELRPKQPAKKKQRPARSHRWQHSIQCSLDNAQAL